MLEKVGFKNFLALRDVEIDLEPFTVIVGPNSSGKSTILEGIDRVSKSHFAKFAQTLFLTEDEKNEKNILSAFNYVINQQADEKIISITIKDSEEYPKIFQIESMGERVNFHSQIVHTDEFHFSNNRVIVANFQSQIVKFSHELASKPSYSTKINPKIDKSGLGLPTLCAYLQLEDNKIFSRVKEMLCLIIPNLVDFRVKPESVPASYWFDIEDTKAHQKDVYQNREAIGHGLYFDFIKTSNIPAKFVSEGTILSLMLLVFSASQRKETVFLIDDLEKGLHPKAVRELITSLRKLQILFPTLQILATSHSPYVLHSLKPNEVRVVTLDPERGTLVAPLEAYPEFDKWRDAMTPGEFWSFVGEDWVKDLPTLEKTSA